MKILTPIQIAVLVLGAAGIISCASPRKGPPSLPEARIPGINRTFRPGDIVDLHRGEAISFETLLQRIAPHDVVYIGEVHDQPEHHLIQVQILQGLMEQGGPVTVAMEAFRRHHQEALDRHLSGAASEEEFLEEVDWDSTWGFPYHFYRPLISLARENKAPVLAMNVPQDLVRKVAREGLEELTEKERGQLPEEIDLKDRAHREYVRKAYGRHDQKEIPEFEYFYQAQCVYDETMAEVISSRLEAEGGYRPKVAAFVGNGHLAYRFGIPRRVFRRTRASQVVILPYPVGAQTELETETADFLWLTSPGGFRGGNRIGHRQAMGPFYERE
ncbi:MAG: ChaN family lipoprotein [Desulfobacteraceae bacterium]